ncbi:hypothetical protein [Methylobacterium sp. Leaf123]|uniref:hypothetical protein n=1 Tax=Methylobacterium sp. Leaf123 TaxID=1736264 RepID=UPI0012E7232A|nr:hypothetical protein [Methylobacterium sp. Leaf123]
MWWTEIARDGHFFGEDHIDICLFPGRWAITETGRYYTDRKYVARFNITDWPERRQRGFANEAVRASMRALQLFQEGSRNRIIIYFVASTLDNDLMSFQVTDARLACFLERDAD